MNSVSEEMYFEYEDEDEDEPGPSTQDYDGARASHMPAGYSTSGTISPRPEQKNLRSPSMESDSCVPVSQITSNRFSIDLDLPILTYSGISKLCYHMRHSKRFTFNSGHQTRMTFARS